MTVPAEIRVAFRGRLGAFRLDAAFRAPAAGVTAIFGPSGCGKTTVLRSIAGLQRLSGSCSVSGEVWQTETTFLPAHRRPIGYVFQDAGLFPHLSVRGNLLYGASKAPRHRTDIDIDHTMALLGLSALLDRSPRHLSGGERQRVAIGRALLSRPRLLLMDEPLSALDRQAKEDIIPFLERLAEALSIPTLYVTHDMAEIERLADHLVLMQDGRVTAAGRLGDLQSDPALFLIRRRDAAVSLDAVAEAYDARYGLATLAVEGARFLVPTPPLHVGETRRLRVAAGDVSLALTRPGASTIANVVPARITDVTASTDQEMTALLALGPTGEGVRLLARVTRRSWDLLALAPGLTVYAQIKSVALVARHGDAHAP